MEMVMVMAVAMEVSKFWTVNLACPVANAPRMFDHSVERTEFPTPSKL